MIALILSVILISQPSDTIKVGYRDSLYMNCNDEYTCDLKLSLPDGIYAVYNKIGYMDNLKIIAQFKNNRKDGIWQYFGQNIYASDINDTIITRVNEVLWVEFEYEYKEGFLRRNTWYNEDGSRKWELFYGEGAVEYNEWTEMNTYYENGTIKTQTFEKENGETQFIEYYENGIIRMEEIFMGGQAESKCKYYHPNGQKESEGIKYAPLNKSALRAEHGEWKYWNEEGELIKTEIYNKGKKINKTIHIK